MTSRSRGPRTRKPCPGCKRTPDWFRPADDVCSDCRRKLDEVDRLVAERLAEAQRERKPYWVNGRVRFWAHVDPDGYSTHELQSMPGRERAQAERGGRGWVHDWGSLLEHDFTELLESLSDERVDTRDGWQTSSRGEGEVLLEGTAGRYRAEWKCLGLYPEHAVILRRLYHSLRRYCAHVYRVGLQDGENLLSKLVDGELSMAEVADRLARPGSHDAGT